MNKIVIFTDLDGTLLDHADYSYSAAKPCLHYIREHDIPLIFTSSKTAIEIEQLCNKTKFFHPFIAENGGLLCTPKNYFKQDSDPRHEYKKTIYGVTRNNIHVALDYFKLSYQFKSFQEMSLEELIAHTGLIEQNAIYANQRDCSEPILWMDEPAKLKVFENQLDQYNLTLVSGGRFHHVMGKHDKASTMIILIEQFSNYYSQEIVSIALGDSPNDLIMLNNATYGIVIPNEHAPKMCVDNHANLTHATHSGPRGWNESLLTLLMELNT